MFDRKAINLKQYNQSERPFAWYLGHQDVTNHGVLVCVIGLNHAVQGASDVDACGDGTTNLLGLMHN
jgi:hypothetical protein